MSPVRRASGVSRRSRRRGRSADPGREARQRRARALAWRRRTLLLLWFAAAGVVLGRAVQLQVFEASEWREAALRQHRTSSEVPAPRGRILDRDGVELALTRERVRVSVAPRELGDRDEAVRLLRDALGLSPREALRLTDPGRRWSVVRGRYPPAVRQALAGARGVYLEPEFERFYPRGDLARGLLGAVLDGVGRGGIEQSYEDVLRGSPGREVAGRDHAGRTIPGQVVRVEEPVQGGDVRLTLDLDMQELAHQALADALEQTGALGGDLVVTDPHTGEVLALVSMRDGDAGSLSAINTPFEPGSTLKPFTVAGLLARGLAGLEDSVATAKGSWTVHGRTISDVYTYPDMTLAEALRVSSNVGIARAARAYSPGAQYETLRDFGFGLPTGIELPGEVAGTLRRPDRWSRQSPASLAIGYEIAVTPVQMALAYGALANGGVLMAPRLVAEIRGSEGRLAERVGPRQVRRVIPVDVAGRLAGVLEAVVEDGTATAARLATFRVAGKTGTSRVNVDGDYLDGRYYSSFVGFFPADAPQMVVFVKLDSPRGVYYGGATAAPVTRAMMEGALAVRQSPLDRAALLRSLRTVSSPEGTLAAAPSGRSPAPADATGSGAVPSPLRLASFDRPPPGLAADSAPPADRVPGDDLVSVPDLAGLPSRTAARRLHALGFRVRWLGSGPVAAVSPAPGLRLESGDTVTLHGVAFP